MSTSDNEATKSGEVMHVEKHSEDSPSPAISAEHEAYVLQRHGRLDLSPFPSSDPNDPLNWPSWKKDLQIGLVVFHAAMNTFTAAAPISGFGDFAKKYGVSIDTAVYLTSVQVNISLSLPCIKC
jgi:hypothetical protein